MMLPKLNLRLAQFCASTASASRTTPSLSSSSSSSSLPAAPSPSSSYTSRTRLSSRLTYPLVLLSLLLLVLHPVICNAERDFNFNDSQVPLLEPRDEPILIDGHHYADSTTAINANAHHHHHQDPYAVELSHCRYGENELVLSLVLKNYNWQDVSESRRDKVLDKLSKFFAIPKEFITTESVTKHELSEMQKESLKKGNNKCHTNTNNNRKLGRVNFIIGCRSSYFSITEPIAKQIGQQFKDGALDNIAGEKFGCWVIWRKHHKTRSTRNRRQAEGSGMIDNDDYDGDYEYEDDEEEIIDEPSKEAPSSTTTNSQQDNNSNRDVPDDDENDVNSNTLEHVTNVDKTKSHNRDDITALKQTDADTNIQEVEKSDSNLLLLNKKGVIDEEIVESVSELESVISKTIENTKNIKEIPEREVDQPEDVLLKEVLQQPTQAYEDSDNAKNSEHLNLNSIYESPNEEDLRNSHDFSVAEVVDSLSPQTSTVTSGVKLDDIDVTTISSVIGTTTTALPRTHHNTNKDNHFEKILQNSSSSLNHDLHHQHHHHNSGENGEHHHKAASSAATEFTSSSAASGSNSNNTTTTLLPPLPPIILTDSTTLTLTTPHDNSAIISSPTMTSSVSGSVLSTTTTSTSTTATTSSITTNNHNNNNKEYYDTTFDPEDDEDVDSSKSSTITTPQSSEDGVTSTSSTEPSPSTTTPPPTSPSTTSTTTTTAVPDYIEPKMENSPPMIKTRLQKLAVTSGKSFKFTVPEDTFVDTEDKSNLRLQLTDKEGRELKTNSWLQFNAETKDIYGLPLDDAVSRWEYRLTATDSGNESVTETVEVSVQQHRGVRTVNHEINIAVKINEKNMHYIDWQLSLIKAIATTLGDDNTNSIVVREIRQNPQDPSTATLVYFNETLPTSECPESELNNLVKRLDANRLSELVQPTLGIKSITGQLIGSCQKTVTVRPKPTVTKNAPPVPRNQVDRVVATAGHLLVYKVPADTFFDPNDSKLVLSLKTKDHKELSPRHWLQFDSKNDEFYGIPKTGDTGSEEYMLVAEDAGGLTATDALVVTVNHAPKREFSVYYKAHLAIRHEQFNADLQRKFVERIAQMFGDASTQNIQIRSINTMHDSDGTLINFYNTTLYKSHNRCPEEEMEAVRNVYLQDNTMRDRVRKALGPELNITNLQVHAYSCSAQTDIIRPDFVPNKTEEPLLKSTFSDDYLYTIILPAVIIVTMILVASIIACCLHRRRRKSGKMELGDEEERKSFRTKGIPVIFQDELDEKPEIGNKSPIILKDEKPPLLPPSYNTSNMNGDNDVDEYVPPPAVVVGGREARGKSPATPSYRKPPPYVSP